MAASFCIANDLIQHIFLPVYHGRWNLCGEMGGYGCIVRNQYHDADVYLASALGMMFGTGGNALVAKKLGEGKQEKRRKISLC